MDASSREEEEAFYRHKHAVDAVEVRGAVPDREGQQPPPEETDKEAAVEEQADDEQQTVPGEVESDGEVANREADEAFLESLYETHQLLEDIEVWMRRLRYSPEGAEMMSVVSENRTKREERELPPLHVDGNPPDEALP